MALFPAAMLDNAGRLAAVAVVFDDAADFTTARRASLPVALTDR